MKRFPVITAATGGIGSLIGWQVGEGAALAYFGGVAVGAVLVMWVVSKRMRS